MSVMDGLNMQGIELRQARSRIRHQLEHGDLWVNDVLRDPPACIRELFVLDVLRWQHQMGRSRIQLLNERAVRDGVNLMVRVGFGDKRVLDWLDANLWARPKGRWVFRGGPYA